MMPRRQLQMNTEKWWSKFFHEQSLFAGAVAVLAALVVASVDWDTWIELNVAVLYGIPLVLCLPTRSRRLLWGMAAFLLITTFVVYALQIPRGRFSPVEPFFIDRLASAAALLVIASLLHHRMATLDAMEAQQRTLNLRNEELDRRRREAEDATRRKTGLLASASHDIRTPVYAISLTIEALRQAADDPLLATKISGLVDRLQSSARALDRLLSDLLDVARFDSGAIVVQESIFLLDDLLFEQCNNLLPLADAKKLRLEVNAPDRPISLRTDRVKLARVIANLLGNAIKFTQQGNVVISVEETPAFLLIRVRDTGVGIAAEHLDHIFDEFAQLQNAASDHDRGWGLGLAICRRLMEALGGGITVESSLGQGSTFIISLPSRCLVDRAVTAAGVATSS